MLKRNEAASFALKSQNER